MRAPAIAPSVHPIRLLRTRRDWSLRTLAGHSGVGFRLLWQYENGLRIPAPALERIAKALKVPTTELQ